MCSNEGVVVNTILGTENGRIFFTSGDSHVYEIVYKRGVWIAYHKLLCLGRFLWLLLLLHQHCGWKQDYLPSLKTLQGNVLRSICYLHWSYLLRSCYWTAVYSFGSLLVASCFTCSDNSLYVYSLGKERNTFVYVNSIRSIKEACSHYFERQPEYSVLFNSTIRDHERFVCIPVVFDRLVSGDGHSCHRSEYTIELLHDCGSHTFWHPLILLHFCGSGRSSSSGWKSILSHGFQFDRSLLCIWFSFVLMVSRFVFLLISQDTIRTTTTMLNKDPCWMRFPSQSLKNWTNSLTLLLVALRWLLHGPSSSWTMLRTTAMLFTVFLYFWRLLE